MDIQLKPLSSFTIPSSITKLGDYCFSNCCQLQEIKGLEQIREFGVGCLNLHFKNQFTEDHWNIFYGISPIQKKYIEDWTQLNCKRVLFDSDIDDWNVNSSVLNERVIGKKQLVFLILDTEGELFGYYENTTIKEIYHLNNTKTNSNSFHFNLQSNGRYKQPMKFRIGNTSEGYLLFNPNDHNLISLGAICLSKRVYKNKSCCIKEIEWAFSNGYDETSLCGKSMNHREIGETFTPQRILVIQMN